MQLLTVIRGTAWIGLVVAGWSLNLRWGVEEYVGNGPPSHLSRHVVGTALLLFVCALVLSIAGRGGNPPSWRSRAIAGTFALGAVLVMLRLRSLASDGQDHYLAGPGFLWFAVGTGIAALACVFTLALRREGKPRQSAVKKPRRDPGKRKRR